LLSKHSCPVRGTTKHENKHPHPAPPPSEASGSESLWLGEGRVREGGVYLRVKLNLLLEKTDNFPQILYRFLSF